ncbi:hypothetical protein BZU93_30335, partial [Salmonella enterica subsp. enterica]|nr:hypothetical protein [Salmonella enterica subsp. enterica serovar Enteritidis]
MNQVVTELTIDARGAEAGSTTYVRAMQVAQAAVDRVIERSRTLSAASEENSARMLGTSTSVARAAAAFDRLKASIDPTHASALAMQKDILVLDRAVTTLGVSETESARIMDQLVLKHDAVAQSVRRRAQEYASLRSAEAGAAFNMDVNRSFGIGNQPKSARDSMTAFTAADNETALYQRRLSEVRAEVDPLAAAVGRL